jgi:S1-C subfamily serine protease
MKCVMWIGCGLVLLLAGLVLADTLTLTDGTVLEGRVAQQGDKYWIKLNSGESRTIPKTSVKEWKKGAAAAAGGAPAAGATGAAKAPAADANTPATPAPKGGVIVGKSTAPLSFAETKSRAERVDAPLAAVGLWQSYIDANPDSPDLAEAKVEIDKWKKMDKDKSEKINGKWVGGEERKKLIEKVSKLLNDAEEMQHNNQTVKAVQKLEEAVKIYPNSFRANFELGYYCITKAAGSGSNARLDQAIKSLELAGKLRPNSAAAWSNLAVAYNFRGKYEQSVLTAYKAAQIDDDKDVVQNLVNSIVQAPPGMRENNTKVRPIMEEAFLLASKRGVGTGRQNWVYVRPKAQEKGPDVAEEDDNSRPGVIGNGSGFIVSDNGYVLTNRHVAQVKNCIFMCRFSDGSEKTAKVIVIDDDADIALLKLAPDKDKKFPFLKLAEAEEPGPGAECSALGYPVANVMNYAMQVTSGTVSSVSSTEPYHVTLTAKITHGNSGGPLVDKRGNVIGIVSAGLTAYTETYGKALSAGQVRKFIDKVKDKMTDAAMAPGSASAAAMSTEEIYKKDSPAVLCVIMIRSGGGAGGADEE